MTIEQLNTAEPEAVREQLLRCCGSNAWAAGILARRPFRNREELFEAAESVWCRLSPSDWLEAFSAHPKIGVRKNGSGAISRWSSEEQSGVDGAGFDIVERLAKANNEYESRFGWIFLISATGKSATEILHELELRLNNESVEELRVAAGEQAKITRIRLNKLLDE